jgi:hypothetical protein
MRFMIKERGGVNAAVFIEFLKRLIIGAKRAIFLIVDRGPAHIAKKTKASGSATSGSGAVQRPVAFPRDAKLYESRAERLSSDSAR